MKRLRYLISWLFMLGVLFLPELGRATGTIGLTVTPALQNVDVQASEEAKSFTIKLTNHTSETMTLAVTTADFGALEDTGGLVFVGASSDFEKKYGLAAWLTLEKNQITLSPGATDSLVVMVNNRDTLAPGGHYAAVLFKRIGESVDNGPRVRLDQVAASLVFLRKSGGENYSLSLSRSQPELNWTGIPRSFKLRFGNSGNIHLVPRGVVTVSNLFGKEVARGIINSQSGILLPESSRIYQVDLRHEASIWWPGLYKVKTYWTYDGKDELTLSASNLSVFPIDGVVTIVVILALFSFASWFAYRRRYFDRLLQKLRLRR